MTQRIAKRATTAGKRAARTALPEGFSRFDAADYLVDEGKVAVDLDAAAEEGDSAAMAEALGTVARARARARARNMSQLARDTGMSRVGLAKALAPGGNPSLATAMKVAKALGLKLSFRAG
ncbi:MAG: addiction module antidote protein [Hyphomicrobium sp.]